MDLKGELLRELQGISVEQNKLETKSHYHPAHADEYYSNLIWHSIDYHDIEKIEIQLIVVENVDQRDLFDYIRHRISSMPQCQTPGRVLSVLVYDQYSQTYLGIIQLNTDLLQSEYKDQFMGLDPNKRGRLKQHIRDHSANLSICVPVQPFGFNFCGGKLLAMLAFSIELHQFYQHRYSHSLALITTTSIHGKSIQYDRLKQLKFIGLTKGFGTSHIPLSFISKGREFLQENHPQCLEQKQSNWQLLKILAQKLNIDQERLFYHGNQRGIYSGWTGTNAREFLLKQRMTFTADRLQTVKEITTFWMQRWARQRFMHLNQISVDM